MTDQPRITIDAPSEMVILAARHLDATEGPVQVGATVDAATRSAITTVLRYIATAHNAPPVPGEKGAPRRCCRYCPDPLCPEDCPECGAPIHDLDAVPAQHQRDHHPETLDADGLTGYTAPDPPIGCINLTAEPDDPTQCSGEEGFCPEHGLHRHSLKQPAEPGPDCSRTTTNNPATCYDTANNPTQEPTP